MIMKTGLVLLLAAVLISGLASCGSEANEGAGVDMQKDSAKAMEAKKEAVGGMEKATFAAGCFWGVEAAFRGTEGVISTQVGYTGGSLEGPSYHDVCTGKTGHAEAVEVTFDPSRITYEELLGVFWQIHDPRQVNRQGPDVGSQYRSAIFYHSPEQEAQARASKKKLQESGKYKGEIVTQIVPAGPFYRAEEYHQQYLEKRGRGSCAIE